MTPIELCGERVRLAPLTLVHVPALLAAGQDPAIWPWMPQRLCTREDFQGWAEEALANQEGGTELPLVIVDGNTGEVVGSTRFLDFSAQHRHAEIGWTWLAPAVWRTTVNTECKLLMLQHAFETLDLVRVCLKTDARNLRSQMAIERLGAVKEGILRRHRILPDGRVRDSVYYSVVADEWPAVKQRLGGFLRAER